jgi:hydroxymethylglutaryl-CoA lyase
MKLNIPSRVELIDITLRDGFQHEEKFIPTEAKLYIAQKLIAAGFTRLEVGTFSYVKYVPQFKDIEALLSALPKNDAVEYTVLALNKKACERVIAQLDAGAKIDRVLTGQIATSEAYAKKNMNRTREELFNEAKETVKMLHNAGIKKVAGNIGTIFGCPVQGEVPIETAYEFVDRMFSIGFDEVEHSDPDGKATPKDIIEYFDVILSRYPDPNKHSFHIHDIRGTGIAGYFAALQAGLTTFDVALGGIGGQVANFFDGVPVKGAGDYYLESRRTGLVCTEDFATMLNEMNVQTGIAPAPLYKLGMDVEKILGRSLHSFTSPTKNVSAMT